MFEAERETDTKADFSAPEWEGRGWWRDTTLQEYMSSGQAASISWHSFNNTNSRMKCQAVKTLISDRGVLSTWSRLLLCWQHWRLRNLVNRCVTKMELLRSDLLFSLVHKITQVFHRGLKTELNTPLFSHCESSMRAWVDAGDSWQCLEMWLKLLQPDLFLVTNIQYFLS